MPQPPALIRNLRQKARHLAFSSIAYNWSLGGVVPAALSPLPPDTWPGSAEQGRAFAATFTAREAAWPLNWQTFDHLRDLRTFAGPDARRLARESIDSWIHRHKLWSDDAWAPALTGRRIANWIALYDFYGTSADAACQERLFDSIVRQARHLARALPGDVSGLDLLHGIHGLASAGLAFSGRESWLEQALDLLQKETGKQILPDGGHVSRSPRQLLNALRIVMDIRTALAAGGYPVPEQLEHTVDRMAQAVRFFRMPDRLFAVFNGSPEGDENLIDIILTRANAHGRILRHLPHTGYERLTLGRSLLVIDAGAPPPRPYEGEAHAAPLAFEFMYGRERVLVSCGTHPTDPAWKDALKGSGAHNTLTLDNRNACEIRDDGHIGRRPRAMSVNRQESRDAVLFEGAHDGYVPLNGITHRRRLYLTSDGHDLRGEENLNCATGLSKPVAIALRFHLHPRVQASLIQDGAEALIRLSGGAGWRFSSAGGRLALEDSLYLGSGSQPRKTKQLVLYATMDTDAARIKWALQRESF